MFHCWNKAKPSTSRHCFPATAPATPMALSSRQTLDADFEWELEIISRNAIDLLERDSVYKSGNDDRDSSNLDIVIGKGKGPAAHFLQPQHWVKVKEGAAELDNESSPCTGQEVETLSCMLQTVFLDSTFTMMQQCASLLDSYSSSEEHLKQLPLVPSSSVGILAPSDLSLTYQESQQAPPCCIAPLPRSAYCGPPSSWCFAPI